MMRLIGLIVMLLSSVGVGAAQDNPDLQLKSATSLSELDESMRIYNITLAPDGSALAWGSGRSNLCVYLFADDETTCYELDLLRGFGRYSFVSWSPGSESLSFNESLFDMFYESDLWVFDLASGNYQNRTDDGAVEVLVTDEDTPTAMLDYAATWNPANGDLYFFRSVRQEEGYITELYLLPLNRTEPKLVRDLTTDFPVLSVFRPPVISPDGTQMAMIVLAQNPGEDERSGIWTLNLSDGRLEQAAGLADLQDGMPEWIGEYLLLPDSVAWAGDNALVVMAIDFQTRQALGSNAYYVDLAADTVQPMVDFSDIETENDLFDENADGTFPILRVPKGGAVTPDGSTWVYVGSAPQVTEQGLVWAVNLPPDGGEPTLIGTIDSYEVGPWLETRNSFASDGSKALIWGYVLEFE